MAKQKRRVMAEMNVVPYIDVMLVLLVIFMITAPLLTQGVTVDLPKADAKALDPSESEGQEPLVVSVDAAGQFFLNVGDEPDQPVSPQILMARAAAVLRLKPNTPVMVKGDRGVNYGRVVSAMALLQKAGAPKVGLITDPPPAIRSLEAAQ